MSQEEYLRADDAEVSWRCFRCKTFNANSLTFHAYNVPTSNSFSLLQDLDESIFNPSVRSVQSHISREFNPGMASSPRSSTTSDRSRQKSTSVSHAPHVTCDKQDNLRFLVLNANSIKGKAAELEYICEYTRPDVIVMSETKIDKSVCSAEFLPNRFTATRKDRTLHGGGVMIAVRRGLIVDEIPLKGVKKNCELVFVRVKMTGGAPPLLVGAYYRSQTDNTTNESLDGLDAALQQVSSTIGNSKATVVLAGDFNCKDICWDTHSTQPGNPIPRVCEKLLKISSDNGLVQLQREPTRQNSLLDLFTSNESLVSSIHTIPGISTVDEHEAIVVDMTIRAQRTKESPRKIYQWGKARWATIREETAYFSTRFCADSLEKPVDEQWELIEAHISTMLESHVPTKKSKARFDQPWLTTDLKRRCNRKQRLYNKWKKLKARNQPCGTAREAYKKLHLETNHLLQKSRMRYINNILAEGLEEKSTRPFWRFIKSQRTESFGVAPLKEKGQVYSDSGKKASILANQFRSVFTVDDDEAVNTFLHGPSLPAIPDITISEQGIRKLLKGVDPRKASGPDQIPCRMLQELHVELAPVFTALFRNSYQTGSLPAVWKAAWISPVFKKGDKCVAANYRPVSLTCVACKLLEHVLCSHIRDHLDRHNALSPYQHGFRKKMSCESQLLVTTHDLLSRLDHKEEVDVGVLDFSKAFDVVPHKRLMSKLRLYGVEGKISCWISEFLLGRTQSVLVDGVRSHTRCRTDGDPVLSGVPQGTVMGPLLFLLYINDLPSVLNPSTSCRLFADDCLIYRSIHSMEDKVILQRDLDSLFEWGQIWGLKFNVSKCNILHLARQTQKPVRFYTLGGELIGSVTEAKYLGVTLSNNYGARSSQWRPHILDTVSRANQRMGFLRRNLRGSPYRLRETAYTTLVRSSLEYCGAIWDPSAKDEIDSLEIVQRRAARWARGARGIISVTGLLRDLGWHSLADRRRNQRLCLFYKLLHGDLDLPPESVDINLHQGRATRGSHQWKIVRPSAADRQSPLWKSTVLRTIPEWNNLSPETVNADSITSFKSRLSANP